MADYPKNFTKGDQVRHAHSKADEVRLKFAGYRQVQAQKPDSVVERENSGEAPASPPAPFVPELNAAEMAEVPGVLDFDVVDTTNEDSAAYPESPYKRKKN
jgi:hypothetical protein